MLQENPLQKVIQEFSKKRSNYKNEKVRQNDNSIDLLACSDEEMQPYEKPRLEDFLKEFEHKVK